MEWYKKILFEELYKSIYLLSEIGRHRLKSYYFNKLICNQSVKMEGCSYQAVMKSVIEARKKRKKYLE